MDVARPIKWEVKPGRHNFTDFQLHISHFFSQGSQPTSSVGGGGNSERRSRLFSKDKSGGFSLKQQKQGTGGGSTNHRDRSDRLNAHQTSSAASQDISNVRMDIMLVLQLSTKALLFSWRCLIFFLRSSYSNREKCFWNSSAAFFLKTVTACPTNLSWPIRVTGKAHIWLPSSQSGVTPA